MTSKTEELEVEKASIAEDGVKFTFQNNSSERVYDVVKLYKGDKYEGFEYVDIPRGESDNVIFDVNGEEIGDEDHLIFTTDSSDEGVISESNFGDLLIEQQSESGEIEEQETPGGESEELDIGIEEDEEIEERGDVEEVDRVEDVDESEEVGEGEDVGEVEDVGEDGEVEDVDEFDEVEGDEGMAEVEDGVDEGEEMTEVEEGEGVEEVGEVGEVEVDKETDESGENDEVEGVEDVGEVEDVEEGEDIEEVEEVGTGEEMGELEPEEEESESEEDENTEFSEGGEEEEMDIELGEEEKRNREIKDSSLGPENEEVLEESGREIEEDNIGFEEGDPQNTDIPEMESVRNDESSWGSISSKLASFFGDGGEERGEPEEDLEEEELGLENEERSVENREEAVESEEKESSEEPLPSEQVPRISTGVIDLDEKMQGGLVKNTMNLIAGKTGTGKTAFSACFLKQGIEEDEHGVYVTTEEREADIHDDIRAMFGWDFREYEEEGKLDVISIKPVFPSKEIENLNRLVRSYITDLLNEVKTSIEEIDADRVVIDSVSIIEMFIRDEYMARVALAKLLNSLREEEVTAVLTGGVPETSEGLSGGGIIEFLVDAVLLMEFVPVAEDHSRTLTIRKMRRTDHEVDIFPLEITPNGMKIEDVEGGAI